MKSKEIHLDNYVLYKGNVIKVKAVHEKKIGYHIHPYKLEWVRIGLLEPIPLSIEILDKNFKVNVKDTEDFGVDLSNIDAGIQRIFYTVCITDTKYWNFIWLKKYNKLTIEDNLFISISYVHELQNLLSFINMQQIIL